LSVDKKTNKQKNNGKGVEKKRKKGVHKRSKLARKNVVVMGEKPPKNL